MGTMRTMKGYSKCPLGEFRMPPMDKDASRKIRILTNCADDGPFGGVPAYLVHIFPSTYKEGEKDRLACIDENSPGECGRIILADGQNYHRCDTTLQAVIAFWNYEDRQIQIMDISQSMWRTIMRFQTQWGDVRGYDFVFAYEDAPGQVSKQRVITPQPDRVPLSDEVAKYVEQYLPTIEAAYWPNLTAEVIADFLGGTLLKTAPAASSASPGGNFSPPPPGPGPEAVAKDAGIAPPPGLTIEEVEEGDLTKPPEGSTPADEAGFPAPPPPPGM